MWNQSIFVLVAISIAGCASTAPKSFSTAAPGSKDQAFDCVMREFNQMNYTIRNSDRGSGFITAETHTSGAASEFWTGKKTNDQLTAAIFSSGSPESWSIRITAASSSERTMGWGSASESSEVASEEGIADAKAVLSSCGNGAVRSQQSSGVFSGTVTVS